MLTGWKGIIFWWSLAFAFGTGVAVGSGTSIGAAINKIFWVGLIGIGIALAIYFFIKNR
ncbi:hypothetical protein HYX10_04425 [Candidatus Woesearchaeota archaeon]|nr:hypothetical protein [Candidatus Woesearchaeota archaeon]